MTFPSLRHLLGICVLSTILACGSSTPSVTIGTVQVGTYSFDITREGDAPTAGVTTRYVLKSNATAQPTSITGWAGIESGEGSVKAVAVFDPADGDFDDDFTVPSPVPSGAKFYFDVDTDGEDVIGSADLK